MLLDPCRTSRQGSAPSHLPPHPKRAANSLHYFWPELPGRRSQAREEECRTTAASHAASTSPRTHIFSPPPATQAGETERLRAKPASTPPALCSTTLVYLSVPLSGVGSFWADQPAPLLDQEAQLAGLDRVRHEWTQTLAVVHQHIQHQVRIFGIILGAGRISSGTQPADRCRMNRKQDQLLVLAQHIQQRSARLGSRSPVGRSNPGIRG